MKTRNFGYIADNQHYKRLQIGYRNLITIITFITSMFVTKILNMETEVIIERGVKRRKKSEVRLLAEKLHSEMKEGDSVLLNRVDRTSLMVTLGRLIGTKGATNGMYSIQKEEVGFRLFKNRDK